MGRTLAICLAAASALERCDEPVGPQPDQPIRPPPGYTGAPPAPPGPPQPKAAATPSSPVTAEAAPPAPAAAPPTQAAPAPAEPRRCPSDAAEALAAKARNGKDKKRRIELKLYARPNGPGIAFRKVMAADEGGAEDVKADGAELTALVTPANPKAKVKLRVALTCGWEDRVVLATLDAKSLQVTLREVPPLPEPGYLNVTAEAGTRVSVSGRELGVGPVRNVALPPGKYQVKLEPRKGKAKVMAVEIKSAQTLTVPSDEKKKR